MPVELVMVYVFLLELGFKVGYLGIEHPCHRRNSEYNVRNRNISDSCAICLSIARVLIVETGNLHVS